MEPDRVGDPQLDRTLLLHLDFVISGSMRSHDELQRLRRAVGDELVTRLSTLYSTVDPIRARTLRQVWKWQREDDIPDAEDLRTLFRETFPAAIDDSTFFQWYLRSMANLARTHREALEPTCTEAIRQRWDERGRRERLLRRLGDFFVDAAQPRSLRVARHYYTELLRSQSDGGTPDGAALFNLGQVYMMSLGEEERGLGLLKHAFIANPQDPQVTAGLAGALQKRGLIDDARAVLEHRWQAPAPDELPAVESLLEEIGLDDLTSPEP